MREPDKALGISDTAESEDRIDAFERGELAAVDGPAALEELRSSLKK